MQFGGSAGAAAELLGPDVSAAVAFELARLQADPGLLVRAEDVFAMARGLHPGPEDRGRGAEAAAPPGDVLPGVAAVVSEVRHPVGEFAFAGFVAELVAAEDVPCLVVGGLGQGLRRDEAGQPAGGPRLVDEAEHRPLLGVGGSLAVILAVAGQCAARETQEASHHQGDRDRAFWRHGLVIPGAYSLNKEARKEFG